MDWHLFGKPDLTPQDVVNFRSRINLMDIGAACIAETPVYKVLLDEDLAFLNAFEGDLRQVEAIRNAYGESVRVFPQFLSDGTGKTLYVASESSGMTSLLKPDLRALKLFNGFEQFGLIEKEVAVQTARLDDVPDIGSIDFLKMDIQGAELDVLKHGTRTLEKCVAIQLETSFVCLYENQPTFGEVDVWMRSQGFTPHCYLDVKRWSIAPTIRDNNFRQPFNQLLEADMVYIKDPLKLELLDAEQLKKLALISHYCLASFDLAVHAIMELVSRGAVRKDAREKYLGCLAKHESGK